MKLTYFVEESCGKKGVPVVFPKPNIPPVEESDIKTEPTCTPKKSIGSCQECINSEQCIEGYFCCPYMKVCVKSPYYRCQIRPYQSARCNPPCRDNTDLKKCEKYCNNSRFPKKWGNNMKGLKPTCEGNKY